MRWPLDTLKFSKKLVGGGFTAQQVETPAFEQAALVDEKLATKIDIGALEQRTASRIDALKQSTSSKIEALQLRR